MHASLSAAEKLLRCHVAGLVFDFGRGRAITLLQCRRSHMRGTQIREARQLTAGDRTPLQLKYAGLGISLTSRREQRQGGSIC